MALRLYRAEDLLPLTAATPTPETETETARRKKLSFSPGIALDALAGRRTVLCDPTTATPAGDAEVVRLGRLDDEPEASGE
ncbi:hypothetical protein JWS13_05145 (plasmid) [Rhodococcus pseudokoreensis]|uniref:Uncharacterized protein n=1 Tax=Rhodococcus pseudokoreensis TaxID=2811421 RepID=A0A974VYT9_9NOCA|nr:hypothetical protein JWS13_05145 [Rhodococcus pseudokoreensis]